MSCINIILYIYIVYKYDIIYIRCLYVLSDGKIPAYIQYYSIMRCIRNMLVLRHRVGSSGNHYWLYRCGMAVGW